MESMMDTLTKALILVSVFLFTSANELSINDFLDGRPLTKDRVVNDILEYYQRPDPVGIPVLDVPEPLVIDKNVTASSLTMHGITLTGHSGTRLQYVKVNATDLSGALLVRIPRVEVLSVYEYVGWYSSSTGDMNMTFVDLAIKADVSLGSNDEARLQVQQLEFAIEKEEFLPYFENPTTTLSIAAGTADTFFDTIAGTALSTASESTRRQVNARLVDILRDKRFPKGIEPVDIMVAQLKLQMKEKFDPMHLGSKAVPLPAGIVLMANSIQVEGLSTLHRTQEVSLQLIDNRAHLIIQIGTQAVTVATDLQVTASFLSSFSTSLQFRLDSFSIWVEAHQAADVRHPPQLRRIHLELGNFQLSSSDDSTVSYIMEAVVNILPNILRNTLLEKIEPILHQKIQQQLNTIDVERIIQIQLQKFTK